MVSALVSRLGAVLLALGGAALLFASDAILPALIPGMPPAGAWLGQLLGAAWLGVAALDWLHRSAVVRPPAAAPVSAVGDPHAPAA